MRRFLACWGLALLLAGCAAETRYRIASFLFDGVPSGAQEAQAEAAPQSGPEDSEGESPAGEPTAAPPRAAPITAASTHQPFGQRRCASCHDPGSSNRLVREGPELCFGCHQGIITGKRVAHVPAVAECLLCHRPHQAENPRLLQQPLPDLCLMCHDRQEMLEVHGEIGECLSCHNPHESDEDRLLDFL